MLRTVREAIINLPDKSFGEFYQDYVKVVQDSIIKRNIDTVSKQVTSFSDTTEVIKGLNTLTEELKLL